MHALGKTNIGIRSQASVVIVFAAFWSLSIWRTFDHGKGLVNGVSLFWVAATFCGPFIELLFAAVLLISYFRNGRPHRRWLQFAVVAAICPLAVILLNILA